MFDLAAVQSALKSFGLDGWLLAEFRGSNMLARRVLGLEARPITSRRFYYAIPAEGEPRKLVHRIEPGVLDHLPGCRGHLPPPPGPTERAGEPSRGDEDRRDGILAE